MFTPPTPPGIITLESALLWAEEGFRDLERVLQKVGKREPFQTTWAAQGGGASLGNGTLTADYIEIGSSIQFSVQLNFGSTTNAGAGIWTFTLPRAQVNARPGHVGSCMAYDVSGSVGYPLACLIQPQVDTGAPQVMQVVGSGGGGAPVMPAAWANGDTFWATILYPIE